MNPLYLEVLRKTPTFKRIKYKIKVICRILN